MGTPFKLKYKNSAFPFKSPLHHELKDGTEHAHSEETKRGIDQDFITVTGNRGTTRSGHSTGHSSTQGSYTDIASKYSRYTTPKYKGSSD